MHHILGKKKPLQKDFSTYKQEIHKKLGKELTYDFADILQKAGHLLLSDIFTCTWRLSAVL